MARLYTKLGGVWSTQITIMQPRTFATANNTSFKVWGASHKYVLHVHL